ncbi:MAG: nucleotidyltransferase domain-containing protein [Candidatus Woesearchaeota archaeon]
MANPSRSFGLTDVSGLTGISKSNILRVALPLLHEKIIIKEGRLLRINPGHSLSKALFSAFQVERQANLKPELKNAIDLFYAKHQESLQVFILFGSVAQGLSDEKSDIDILVVGGKLQGPVLSAMRLALSLPCQPCPAGLLMPKASLTREKIL